MHPICVDLQTTTLLEHHVIRAPSGTRTQHPALERRVALPTSLWVRRPLPRNRTRWRRLRRPSLVHRGGVYRWQRVQDTCRQVCPRATQSALECLVVALVGRLLVEQVLTALAALDRVEHVHEVSEQPVGLAGHRACGGDRTRPVLPWQGSASPVGLTRMAEGRGVEPPRFTVTRFSRPVARH